MPALHSIFRGQKHPQPPPAAQPLGGHYYRDANATIGGKHHCNIDHIVVHKLWTRESGLWGKQTDWDDADGSGDFL